MITAIPLAAQQLIASLQALSITGIGPRPDYAETSVHPYVFYADGKVQVSGEHDANSQLWIDYYGEYMHGMCWINPVLESWAEDNNGYWEWVNPGSVAFIKN